MNFSISIDEIKAQRQKEELEKVVNKSNQEDNIYITVSHEIDENLKNLLSIQTITAENIISADILITEIFEKLSKLDFVPGFLIDHNDFCDRLMHYLNPPFSNHITCLIHDIFKLIYSSSEKTASIVHDSSYFHFVCRYYYEAKFNFKNNSEKEEAEAILIRIIYSLRFGLIYFRFNEVFFIESYQKRFTYLINDCKFSEPVIHELLCLTDSMVAANPAVQVLSFVSPFLLNYFLIPNYTKVCCDTFIRCTKLSFPTNALYDIFQSPIKIANEKESTDLIHSILLILPSQNQTYDIKAKVKAFVLLRHILFFYQSITLNFSSSKLTVQIITVDFCNNSILQLLNPEIVKPKHLEMVINSILQITLNDPSIPSIICQSLIFQAIIDLANNPDISYYVGISCRLLFASLLMAENPKLSIFVFEHSFIFLEDLLESDEPEWIINALDGILSFLEKMVKSGNDEIISRIRNEDTYSWLRDCINECSENSVELVSQTAKYINSHLLFINKTEDAAD